MPQLNPLAIRPQRRVLFALSSLALVVGSLLATTGCQQDESAQARAYQSTDRTQLVGGPGALGEVGDYVIENDEIRLVIQNDTFNRGTGLFGGSLIDADLVRQDGQGDPFGGNGRDAFGEAFPAFFLEVIDPDEIVILDADDFPERDDIDDGAAILEVRGDGGEFVTLARFFNQAMVNAYEPDWGDILGGELPDSDGPALVEFTARYILEPGDRHVRIESELTNVDDGDLPFPNPVVELLIDQFLGDDDGIDIEFDDFSVPTGLALGFGAMNDLFMPGFGYDVRFGLEDTYEEQEIDLPALPGHLTEVLATSSTDGVSYGFATSPDEDANFPYNKQQSQGAAEDYYGDDVEPHEMLFLFEAAGYGGAFTHELPDVLEPGETFTATNHFVVGSGDVASIRDEVYGLHDIDTHTVTGRIFDDATGEAVGEHANIFIYEASDGSCAADDDPYIVNQAHTNADGYFEFQLPSGDYCYRTQHYGDTADFESFAVDDQPVQLQATAPGHAYVEAFITDHTGNPIPAKMTIVGTYEPRPDMQTRDFLFDLSVGERWRTSESVDIDPDDGSAEFIETIEFSSADGRASAPVTPGEYTVYFSRGSEYELVEQQIEVSAGDVATLNAQVERLYNPDGYLSGDYHMHAEGSIDSGLDYNDRVISIAGEGVEVVVSSDHNYIADYTPYIHRNNLQPFLRSIVGLELTTMEAGHFNAFPLRQDVTSQNRGSVAWQNDPPDQIFDRLRDTDFIGTENTVIQVNHPRDSILGYFSQHNVDALSGVAELPINALDDGAGPQDRALAAAASPSGPAFAQRGIDGEETTFSYDFDAIEIFNGKRIHLIHHFRMPDHSELSDDDLDFFRDDDENGDENGDDDDLDIPEAGTILCDGDDVAYPGGLDDWFNFLNYRRPGDGDEPGDYRKYTATANSDSHHYGSPDDPEPGFPKNYFWAGHNDPQNLRPGELSQALHDNHNIATNGPFVTFSINDEPVGSTTSTDDGQVTIDVTVKAADWVVGDEGLTLDVVANGERIIEDIPVELQDYRWNDQIEIDLDDYDFLHHADGGDIRDTWFLVEVTGDNNMFPVVQPAEIPMVPFDEALGSIAEPFGFGDTPESLAPSEITDIYPIAFTNPIWVIDNEDGDDRTEFEPPEPPVAQCVDDSFQAGQLTAPDHDGLPFGERRLDARTIELHHDHPSLIEREQGELRDVRSLFNHWHDH